MIPIGPYVALGWWSRNKQRIRKYVQDEDYASALQVIDDTITKLQNYVNNLPEGSQKQAFAADEAIQHLRDARIHIQCAVDEIAAGQTPTYKGYPDGGGVDFRTLRLFDFITVI
jgi:hypothetical protein